MELVPAWRVDDQHRVAVWSEYELLLAFVTALPDEGS
jgi:hypothetical protein